MRETEKLALYTTVYPGVEEYLADWYLSVRNQTDRDFDIWVGVDGLDPKAVEKAIGAKTSAIWVMADRNDSEAQVRQRPLEQIVKRYSGVVLADSDDVLEPTRVEASRKALRDADVCGCAMRIIDAGGRDTGQVFCPPREVGIGELLSRGNVFGLSNTSYRSETLERCLPIPSECILVDWYLVTRALAHGARFFFDRSCRMAYRQHSRNVARIFPPFTHDDVLAATGLVLQHLSMIPAWVPELSSEQRTELSKFHNTVLRFQNRMSCVPEAFDNYISELNGLPPRHIWWDIVAHHLLEDTWTN